MRIKNLDSVLQLYYNERIIPNLNFMREILTLSLPKALKEAAQKMAKKRGFGTISGYIRYLIEEDKDVITDDELWREIQIARKEYKEGKTIKAKSLKDLL